MRRMTKIQHRKYARLCKARFDAVDAIFRAAEKTNVPFKICKREAPPELQRRHSSAVLSIALFQSLMVEEERAWVDAHGVFHPHY